MNHKLLCLPAFLLAGPNTLQAQVIQPFSQTRFVLASSSVESVGGQTDEDSAVRSAADYRPFAASVESAASLPANDAESFARQSSELTSSSIRVSAAVGYEASASNFDVDARSEFRLDFTLDAPATYELSGSLSEGQSAWSSLFLVHSGSWFEFIQYAAQGSGDQEFAQGGVLEAGSYTLSMACMAIVDAGVASGDGSSSMFLELTIRPLDSTECFGTRNSTGYGAHLVPRGSQSLARDEWELVLWGGTPDQQAILFYGQLRDAMPFGDGVLCIAPPIHRVGPAFQLGDYGLGLRKLSFSRPPLSAGPGAILPGSTWSFQYAFRDPGGPGGTGWNTSERVSCTFSH